MLKKKKTIIFKSLETLIDIKSEFISDFDIFSVSSQNGNINKLIKNKII